MRTVVVLIDGRYCSEATSGIGTYSCQLLQAIDEILPAFTERITVYALLLKKKKEGKGLKELRYIKTIETTVDYKSHPKNELWLNFFLPRILKELRADVYHNLAYTLPWLRKIPVRKCVSIHDLVVFEIPGNYRKNFERYLRFMIRRAVKSADKIVVFSEAVRQALIKRFFIRAEKVEKIYHGVAEFFSPLSAKERAEIRQRCALPEKYIFSVGSSEPRKNLLTLIKAVKQLKQEHKLFHKLVIASSDEVAGKSPIRQFIDSPGLKEEILLEKIQSPEKMRDYYNCAEVFVFPTRSEGFGFPVLEAMACGVPVICSNIPPLNEITADCALKFEPDDYLSLAKKIHYLLIDEQKRSALTHRGLQRARQFNWKNAAESYLNLYLSLAQL